MRCHRSCERICHSHSDNNGRHCFSTIACGATQGPSSGDGGYASKLLSYINHLMRDLNAEMIWSAVDAVSGERRECTICLSTSTPHLLRSSLFTTDGVSEYMINYTLVAANAASLEPFLDDHFSTFSEPTGRGAVCLLYSIILSRGIKSIIANIDFGFIGEARQ